MSQDNDYGSLAGLDETPSPEEIVHRPRAAVQHHPHMANVQPLLAGVPTPSQLVMNGASHRMNTHQMLAPSQLIEAPYL